MLPVRTTMYRRGKLPHWEIEHGRYFVTVRLGDSLPNATVARLLEVHRAITAIDARSDAFAKLQQQYFQTMEKYLDVGAGGCLLRQPRHAAVVAEELAALQDWAVDVPHYAIMPNHLHALIVPRAGCSHSLAEIMKRLKGRTAHHIRRSAPGESRLWQREWFDRWLRTDSEWDKVVGYIRENPVKAHLVAQWQDHGWTK
jgi:REP element-mobilizing transposase RayT